MRKAFILIALFACFSLNAQQSLYHLHANADLNKGLELFEKEKFGTAQAYFQKVYENHEGDKGEIAELSSYYLAQCAIKLFNADAEFYAYRFAQEFPSSPRINQLQFDVAGYYYARKKWKNSIEFYNKTNVRKLSKEGQAEYHFKKGYAHFELKEHEKARVSFYEIVEVNSRYTPPARYYYSHIHYEEGNYQTALNGFLSLKDDKNFGPITPYYIVQIYYEQKRYEEIVAFVPDVIETVTPKRLPEVSRMTGEAYFHLEDYAAAIPFLRTYVDEAKSADQSGRYQLAYAYYQVDSIQKAIEGFESISSAENSLGQNASYYLADCYLKVDDKQNAQKAFASASRHDYDKAIQQDALFNYALISFELSSDPFNEAIRAFEEFINAYPESKRIDEARGFLIQAYLNAKNYKLALESIERINNRDSKLDEAYVRIAYNRGIELFTNGMYHAAQEMFTKALSIPNPDALLKARSYYWRGECAFNKGDFVTAIGDYQKFKVSAMAFSLWEYDLVDYNIAYAYFKQEQYGQSADWFRRFATNAGEAQSQEKADALNRAGDSYYMQLDYYQAADFYNRNIELAAANTDYALLQKGICLGLVNKDEEKIQSLSSLVGSYPQSPYVPNAYFENAQAFLKLKQEEKAIGNLKVVADNYSEHALGSKAMVQLGLLYYNQDRNQEAITYYKKTAEQYPSTQQAKDALFGLKNIYVDLGQVEEYANFVNGLGEDAPRMTVNERDSLSFLAAEKQYMNGNCEQAVPGFEKYLSQFPNGDYALNAHFYAGDCHFQAKRNQEALNHFAYVLQHPGNTFMEQALLGCARIADDLGNSDKTIEYYENLISYTSSASLIREARERLVFAYYAKADYANTIKASKALLEIPGISNEIKRSGMFMQAKSLQDLGRDALALELYREVSHEVISAEGAESKYWVAALEFDRGQLDKAEEEILDFSEKSTPHDYWIARSFILWSDVFDQRGNYFQANETLQSIIDYYEQMDDGILELAKSKKEAIEAKQQLNEQASEPDAVEINIEE